MAYDTPYQQKDNTGSIFKNDKKEKDTQPDGKGSCLIDGVEYWVSSWTSATKNGDPYRKLSFTRKEQQTQDRHSEAYKRPEESAYKKPSQDAAKARQLAPSRDRYGDAPSKSEGMANDGFDSDIPF